MLNMSINTLNTEIDTLSMQINGAEDDFFKLLNEYLEKVIVIHNQLFSSNVDEEKLQQDFLTQVVRKVHQLDNDMEAAKILGTKLSKEKVLYIENMYLNHRIKALNQKNSCTMFCQQLTRHFRTVLRLKVSLANIPPLRNNPFGGCNRSGTTARCLYTRSCKCVR